MMECEDIGIGTFVAGVDPKKLLPLEYLSDRQRIDMTVCQESPPETFGRRMPTTTRYAFASIFTGPPRMIVPRLAHKIIAEWNQHDRNPKRIHMRDVVTRILEEHMRSENVRPIAPAKKGSWMCAPPQRNEAPDQERTILLALEDFKRMVGTRTIYVSDPEARKV